MTVEKRAGTGALLALTCVGQFMVLLDNTITSAALPDMKIRLGTTLTGLQWIVDSYVLAVAMLLLAGGVFADRFGGKRVFVGGLVLFTVASALCSVASNLEVLVGARVLQGVGAAVLSPGSLAILASAFPDPKSRVKAIGLWAGFSGIGLAAGPVAGGILVDAFDWRAIFLINLPIGVIALLVSVRILTTSRDGNPTPLDVPGQLLSILSVGALAFGLIEAGELGWTSPIILSCFVAAVVLFVLFLVVETRSAHPMLPLRLFRRRLFAVSNTAMFVVGFGLMGSGFFFSQYFVSVQSDSVLTAGLKTLPCPLVMAVCSPYAGRLAAKFGFHGVVTVGLTVAGAGLLTLVAVHEGTDYLNVWWRLAITGAGFGLAMSPLTGAAIASVNPREGGLASGISSTTRQIGAVFGVAVLGAMVRTRQGDGDSFGAGLNSAFLVAGLVTVACAVVTGVWMVKPTATSVASQEDSTVSAPSPASRS